MPCKLQILIHKQDHISEEEFHRYWSEEHPKIWLNTEIVKKKIITYSQFHVDKKSTSVLTDFGVDIGSWDGIVTMVAESMDELLSVFGDEEYLRVVVPDEKKFLKRETAIMMIGEDHPKKVDGKVVVDITR
ncbi:uncharacterized protein Z520_08265 [Fonsecaea multimorphosa CBS 102226]|uniref:EthD domain-containing protein n=1 Tax=Fonsecaea multimorphosa CBS 102226 TaxID=1442371 RepID=A0A0D2H2D4_9EURO|nr:uncharacterized protein Z520_08265 [Fonsecaea multimorphosa CBS 102226]KIX96010.1 hypothetical protein Z520_08265 [Fonsecaea multimorphosa CBS 102226]OAL21779.1 hypothetical protein AYO22_07721 [Fonsecaea multimorphosa]